MRGLGTGRWVIKEIKTQIKKKKPIGGVGEIIDSFDGSRHLSTIPLKNFYLFKIVESVINFCLKKFSN